MRTVMSTAGGASGSVAVAASSAMVAGAVTSASAGLPSAASSEGSARASAAWTASADDAATLGVSNGRHSCAGSRWQVRCLCPATLSSRKRIQARSAIISARDCGSRGARQPCAGAPPRRGPSAIWHCWASCTNRSSTRLGSARRSLEGASGGTVAGTSSTSAAGSSRTSRSAAGSSSMRAVPSRRTRCELSKLRCAPSSRTSANGTDASAPSDQRSGDWMGRCGRRTYREVVKPLLDSGKDASYKRGGRRTAQSPRC